jgi:hypothetical protein
MSKTQHKVGSQRIITFFAFRPVAINGETKWLCTVSIKQQLYLNSVTNVNDTYWGNLNFEN